MHCKGTPQRPHPNPPRKGEGDGNDLCYQHRSFPKEGGRADMLQMCGYKEYYKLT